MTTTKYFNKYFLRKTDLKALRKGLMESKNYRIVDYGGNWLQVSHHEKLVMIKGRGDLFEEYERLAERTNDPFFKVLADGRLVAWNYDYEKLSPSFRRYMNEVDEIMYHEYYKRLRGASEDDYNRRLERLEKAIPEFTDLDFERYVLLGHPIPTPQYKKALDSARRAYGKVNGLLKSNINEFTEFITLTFAHEKNKDKHRRLGADFDYVDGTNFAEAKQAFTDWMHDMQRRAKYKGYGIKYICVWEMQGNGNYHFHLVTNTILQSEKEQNPEWLDYDSIEKKYKDSVGLNAWKHGKSDIQTISNHAQISTYLSKYILKSVYNICNDDEMMERYKGQKKYFTSKGLKQPIIEYMDDWVSDLEEQPYSTEIINPYNQGVIKTDIYTFIDKEKDAIDQIAPQTKEL